ncbi:MAG: YecA family protein [Burkholderiaceae bacterium]|nr:YecA family protein [Burkholderiaceae bacterium]
MRAIGPGRRDNPAVNPRSKPATRPLSEDDIERLQAMLDAVPAPLDPLDASMLDGFLCGVLLQPQPPAPDRWLRYATDSEGRALPAAFDAKPLHALVLRRHAELAAAIGARQWFDPWVFELDEPDPPSGAAEEDFDEADANPASQAVYPWVAGFALAMLHFPALMALDAGAITAPLALLYRHLQADDLEDADELLAEIETLEPPQDLPEAVEELVRATLLLADVSHPLPGRTPRPRRPTRSARR